MTDLENQLGQENIMNYEEEELIQKLVHEFKVI